MAPGCSEKLVTAHVRLLEPGGQLLRDVSLGSNPYRKAS